mgnify:CR=1 FL=1
MTPFDRLFENLVRNELRELAVNVSIFSQKPTTGYTYLSYLGLPFKHYSEYDWFSHNRGSSCGRINVKIPLVSTIMTMIHGDHGDYGKCSADNCIDGDRLPVQVWTKTKPATYHI